MVVLTNDLFFSKILGFFVNDISESWVCSLGVNSSGIEMSHPLFVTFLNLKLVGVRGGDRIINTEIFGVEYPSKNVFFSILVDTEISL